MSRLIETDHPALHKFREAIATEDSALSLVGVSHLQAIRPHFEKLLADGDLIARSLIDRMLAKLKDDGEYQSANWDINQVILEVGDDYALSVSILLNSPADLFGTAADSMYGVIGATPFNYSLYHHPAGCRTDIFDEKVIPVFHGSFTAHPGEILELKAGRDIIDWSVDDPVVMLRYSSRVSETLQWTYHRQSRKPEFASAATPESTQLMCIMGFLAESGHTPALSALEPLVDHPHHHVRWTAIRAICALDLDAGRRAALNARCDDHPHVRNAAERLLEFLDAA